MKSSFTNKKVTKSNDKIYSEYYSDKEYIELRIRDAKRYVNYIRDRITIPSDGHILEVGCGTAEFGSVLMHEYGSHVYGIDRNIVAVSIARKKGIQALKGDVEKTWPFENRKFDVVIASQIIEHIVNPDNLFTESQRVLKRNGLLIIATPNLAAWFNRVLLPLGYQPFFTEVSTIDKTLGLDFTRGLTNIRNPLGHLRCFTLRALTDMYQLYDFDVIMAKGASVSYLPRYMNLLDQFFSNFPSLATDLLVVGRRK
jgi:ubiquinone/menaquinone biosynthesis C-methylase UbiE